jgi:hypothetical protein
MSRATKRGWFVASAGVVAFVVTGIACSKATTPAETTLDSGSSQPAEGDSSLADGGPDFTLDALPTTFSDSAVNDDASDDATPPAPIDTGVACAKPSPDDPCGLDPQCDCPSLETCDLDGGNGTLCVTAGNALAGHGCTTTASCAPGLTCSNGVCRPYCTLSIADAGGCNAKLAEGGACVSLTNSDAGPLAKYGTCSFRCQLQDPNACGATGDLNGGCISDGVGGTDCIGVGITAIGGACNYINDCKPGLVCAGSACAQWCRVAQTTPSDCTSGEACQAFAPPVPTAYGVEYGYCP